ncbi:MULTISPECIES: capsule biosynthesis protein [Rhizobium]|uniref:capsule biosynthesis protein n=1 Tax=Rhizobium TaxID=379 RepID=UPI0028AF8839
MNSQGPYLFLQGPSSPLFAKIADHLTRAGHACFRINLNVGDQIFWRRGGAVNYRGRLENWGTFIRRFLKDHDIRTIILLGEERPYHKEAVKAATELGATVAVIEMGYLRPDWVTIERDGMSSNSHFPNDPEAILKAAENLPEPDWTRKFTQTFLAEALFDLSYYLPASVLWFLFPHYRFHGIYHPLTEYAGWIGRLAMKRPRENAAKAVLDELKSSQGSWFVYPLQLETDYQLRAHSPFNSQKEAIALVLQSFAGNADKTARLAIKVHPLDNGLISWRRVIQSSAKQLGVADRVLFLDGGDLSLLLEGAEGVVTVNSTAALAGLNLGIRTKVLGSAIYDIPGLTEQRPLNEFWRSDMVPDSALREAFFRLVAASIQERGNFYGREGVDSAAKGVASRLIENWLNGKSGSCGAGLRLRPAKFSRNSIA